METALISPTGNLSDFLTKSSHILHRADMGSYILFSADVRSSTQGALRRAAKSLNKVAKEIQHENFEEQLDRVGLKHESADLNFKLKVFDKFARLFHKLGGKELLGDVLDIINSILGSLASHFAFLEKVTELIDMVKKLLDISSRDQVIQDE
jgi:hypothetical protein